MIMMARRVSQLQQEREGITTTIHPKYVPRLESMLVESVKTIQGRSTKFEGKHSTKS